MTRTELNEFRHLRWMYLKTGRGRIMTGERYEELYVRFWISASELDGIQRVIYIDYYHDARSIRYIAMRLNYAESSVKRIKHNAVEWITLRCGQK